MAEVKEVGRAMWYVLAVPESLPEPDVTLLRLDDYVDALGEPIDGGTLRAVRIVISSPEEVWCAEASHVAQSRIAQAKRFREWVLK